MCPKSQNARLGILNYLRKLKFGLARQRIQRKAAGSIQFFRSLLEQIGRFPGWKLHPLKGGLKGLWSLTVTGNWRLIFRYDETTNTASDIDLIDYH